MTEMVERPARFVRKQMAEKHNEPSYFSAIYEKAGPKMTQYEKDVVKHTAASLYAGGADTVSPISVLIYKYNII